MYYLIIRNDSTTTTTTTTATATATATASPTTATTSVISLLPAPGQDSLRNCFTPHPSPLCQRVSVTL